LLLAPAEAMAPPVEGEAERCVAIGGAALAVVCASGDEVGIGVALGLLLVRSRRAPCALVAVWAPSAEAVGASPRPAAPAARRLAGVLQARGLAGRAAGRVAVVMLPAAADDAAPAAARALATAGARPTVLVLAGPREDAFSEQLAQQDLVVVVSRPDAAPELGDLAVDGLEQDGIGAIACPAALSPIARAVLHAGVIVPRAVERSLGGVVTRLDGAPRDAPRATSTPRTARPRGRAEHGQALLLNLGAMMAVLAGALILSAIAQGIGVRGDQQRAADLAVLAAARSMREAYPSVFAPAVIDGRRNPAHLERAAYLARGRRAALATARRNGARAIDVAFPGDALAPVRVRVVVRDRIEVVPGAGLASRVVAEAELAPAGRAVAAGGGVGEYRGPFAVRDGKPMRPDVALAFDRMATAARAEGVPLVVVSGFRSDAEQAVLFAAHPDPKWVAPAGRSLHRLGTELDIGPKSAHGWLGRRAQRFGFTQRYSWEPWHYEAALAI